MSEKVYPVHKTEEEWRKQLGSRDYEVCRGQGTERAFTGEYWDEHAAGVYRCKCCGQELFSSEAKFDSGTGWPSFFQPLAADRVETRPDRSWFMERTEVVCSRCGCHLGHLFDDGPEPTRLRYCLNSAALKLERK